MTMQEKIQIHDAIVKADEKRRNVRNFYFTFGSDSRYPFRRGQYVLVQAEDIVKAAALYRERHPDRPGSECINCASIYRDWEWERVGAEYYAGKKPVEIIMEA